MEKIYKLLPKNIIKDLKLFTEKEFLDINNKDDNIVRDGSIVDFFLIKFLQ